MASMREFGPLMDGEEEARPREASETLAGAAIRPRSAASVVGAVVGIAVVVAVFALGGPSTAKFLARRHADGGELVLAAGASTTKGSGPFPWGSVMVPECGVDYKIEKVLHSNLGGQGPDHGEEGIVYKCTQSDNGKFVREVLIKAHALSDYASKSAHKNGMHHDFGSISVDSGKTVKVRFSVWDLENKPLTTDTFRITFYDLDEGPHGSSREYLIADDMHPDAQETRHTEVEEKTVHGDLEFEASHVGSGGDNPSDSHDLSALQKARSVVVEYQDIHYFDMTMGATAGHSPRGFAFALHSALACHDVERAITTTHTITSTITTTYTTTTTLKPASPEHRAALLKFLASSSNIRTDDGDMSIPDLFKSRAANPSHATEGDELLDASEVGKVGGAGFSPEDASFVVEDLDTDGDGKVDSGEAMAAMQFYEAVSTFSNNRVDVSEPFQGKELLDASEVRSIHHQAGVDVSPKDASSVVALLDADGDGALNKAELEAHLPFVEAILKTLDKNNHMKTADLVKSHATNPSRATKGDELLDAAEVKKIYEELGEDLSLKDARSRIAEFDADGDDKLDKDELVTPMRFYKAIASMPQNNRNRISDLLKHRTYNPSHALEGDMVLDASEVRDMGQKAGGPKPSLQDASSLVAHLDADGDRLLDIDELAPITPFVPPTAAEAAPFPWWLLALLALLLLCCLLCLLLLCCQGKEEAPKEPEVPPTYAPVVVEEKAEEPPPVVAAPPPAAPPPPPPPYLKLSFVDAEAKPFVGTWNDKPLGFTYTQDQTPVHVTKVVKGGKAEKLGVQTGMKLTGIEFTGQDMTDVENKSFGDTNALLSKGAAILPHETDRPYVELTFVRPSREEELIVKTWYTQPLGITFTPTMPVVVSKVGEGSRAWELGVEVGMEIRSVAHTEMPTPVNVKGETYDNLMSMVGKGMQTLPAAS